MKKGFIYIIFTALVLMLSGCDRSKAVDERSLYVNMADVAVKAHDDTGEYSLRGTIIDMDDQYVDIVTARHGVLTDCNPDVYIDAYKAQGSVIYYSVNHDFAVIRVSLDGNEEMFEYAKPAPISTMPVDYYDEVWYAHTHNEGESAYQEQMLCTITEPIIFFDEIYEDTIMFLAKLDRGESGTGLYNADNELVGIIIACDEDYGLAIPIESIKNDYLNTEDK